MRQSAQVITSGIAPDGHHIFGKSGFLIFGSQKTGKFNSFLKINPDFHF